MDCRPLPDERPRQQSVANLIGRYEKAAKRSSLSNPTSPAVSRATSVVSHNTGDSARIEAKERHEWPPKSDSDTNLSSTEAIAQPLPDVQDALRSLSGTSQDRGALVTSPLEALSDPIAPQAPVEDVFTKSQPETPTQFKPVPSKSVSPISPKKTQPPAKTTGGRLSNSISVPDTRTARSTVSKPAAASTAPAPVPPRSTPVTPSKAQATSAKPLKAQHTGTSASTVRAKSRLGPKSPPTRAKTPTATLPSSPSRSKTPYSNLHAPTQASLARARDAQPPPPPVRKATLPASSLDRLSKPTAASASKARALAVSPPSVSASVTKPARGAPPKRATVKPRLGLAPARLKAEREKKEKQATMKKPGLAKTAAGAATGMLSTLDSNGEVPVEEHTKLEHSEYIEQPSSISEAGGEYEAHMLDSPSQSHEELEHEEANGEGAVGNGDESEIESYDDAYASEIDGHIIPLDSAHIQGAGEGNGSFAVTPEPEGRAPTPAITDAAADVATEIAPDAGSDIEAVEATKHEEIMAELENGHIFESEPNEVEAPPAIEIENSLSNVNEKTSVQVSTTDEIESLVNMLEAKVSLRPASTTGSEASEAPGTIPDDDLLG